MITHKEVERLDNSSVKLNVTVDKESVQNEYGELLKKYRKTAQVKGFRKGKVPESFLEKKFGDGIRQEASANVIENSLKEIFEEIDEKPLPYSTPELQDELDADIDKDLSFSVVYDVFPEVDLGDYKGLEIEVPEVEITEEDRKKELDNLRERNAVVVEAENETVEKDSIVTVDYVELNDEETEKEDTKREGFVFTVGSGYNIYKIDDDIIGMKLNEEKVIEKEYPEDFEYEELQGKKVRVKVKVTAVKRRDLPELDDDFAQDISEKYETLDDLKADIDKRLGEALDGRLRQMKINKLMEKVLENSKIDLPKSMIDVELENFWRNFLGRYRMSEDQVLEILSQQGKDKQALIDEWKPSVEKNLKTRLLTEKMIEKENIEVSDNEVEEEIKKYAEDAQRPLEEVKEEMEKGNSQEYLKHEIQQRKIYDAVLEETSVKKGEKMKFLDFMQDNH